MKKIFLSLMALITAVTITGCDSAEDHPGEAKTPSGSSVYEGVNYHEVADIFKDCGFTNITFKKKEDLVTGWLTEDGEVESVSVDGNDHYHADEWYPNDVEVVIEYHTFPEDSTDEEASKDTDKERLDSQIEETTADETILTVKNCPDLEKLLSLKGEYNDFYTEFAKKYKGQTISFDGCITYLVNHGDYKTRYDLLINGGDYISEDQDPPGPQFKLEDVGVAELGSEDLFPSELAYVSNNVNFTAKVVEFNENSAVFLLDLIELKDR